MATALRGSLSLARIAVSGCCIVLVGLAVVPMSGASEMSGVSRGATAQVTERVAPDWEFELTSAPVLLAATDDLLVVVTEDGAALGLEPDGSVRWELTPTAGGSPLSDPESVAIVDGVVVISSGTQISGRVALVALDEGTGAQLWEATRDGGRAPVDGGNRMSASDGIIAWVTGEGLEALRPADGVQEWSVDDFVGGELSVESVDGVVVARSGSAIEAFDSETGGALWSFSGQVGSVSGLADSVVFEVRSNSSGDVTLVDVDSRTGAEQWEIPSPATRPTDLASAGSILVLADQRSLSRLESGRATPEWTTQLDFTAGVFATPPLLSPARAILGVSWPLAGGGTRGFIDAYELSDGGLSRRIELESEPVGLAILGGSVVAAISGDSPKVLSLTIGNEVASDESVLLGIPTPGEALTAKNAALAGLLLLVLTVLVAVPTTMVNSALEESIDRWRSWRSRRKERRARPRPDGPTSRAPWQRTPGVLVFAGLSALLYSGLQPDWGLNSATLVTAVAFFVSLVATTGLWFATRHVVMTRRHGPLASHPDVEFGTLVVAAACVLGSRAIGFVPGYIYGIVARYETEPKATERDEAVIALWASALTGLVAVTAWVLLSPLGALSDTGPVVLDIPVAVATGVFMAGIELLTVGMLPLSLLPGSALRSTYPFAWKLLWGSGAFLFFLVLLRPGLVDGNTSSVWWTLAAAVVYGGLAGGYWYRTTHRHASGTARGADQDPESSNGGQGERPSAPTPDPMPVGDAGQSHDSSQQGETP